MLIVDLNITTLPKIVLLRFNTMRQDLGVNRLLVRLCSLGLREGVGRKSLLLRLHDRHMVGQRLLGANLTAGVPGQHNLNLKL